jgi:hypothetical protein
MLLTSDQCSISSAAMSRIVLRQRATLSSCVGVRPGPAVVRKLNAAYRY